ncbi:titin-like isoform X2 [Lineus longissimus]|uniref:titin-like isoform X2 n=1 Tax=Lineus longissimus TaxID=88925 RepID=UPI00315C69B4
MASVPSWKQALLSKKHQQQDEDRRRYEQEQKRLSAMPSWKRELILKKKKTHDSTAPAGDKNMVIIESSNKHSEGVNGRSYYPEFSGSQRTTPDSGFDESEEAAVRAGHPAYIQEARWVQVNSAKAGQPHVQRAQQDIPDGLPVENGVAMSRQGDRNSDDELPYQPGFVHKLLDKFSHMTVNERVRRVSQGGTEYSDDSGGSAKSSPRYESDHKHDPSRAHHGSNENLLQEKQVHVPEEKVLRKENITSKEERSVSSKEKVTVEKIETIPGGGKVVIVSSSLPNHGARIPNGTLPDSRDSIDGKVTVSYGVKDEKVEEPVVKNIVSSYKNIFEGGKRRAAPPAPKVQVGRHSQPVQNHTPISPETNEVRSSDSVRIVPSQAKPSNTSDKVVAQSKSDVKVTRTKSPKKGTPDVDSIQKIREAGQSWFYGKDEQGNEQRDSIGATVVSSEKTVRETSDMVVLVSKKEREPSVMVAVGKKPDPVPVKITVSPQPVVKEKSKPEPPKNIEIKPKETVKVEKKRTTEPPKLVEVKSKSKAQANAQSPPSSLTMVEVKVKNKSKGSIIVAPTAPPRKRQAPATPPGRSRAPPPPIENNNEPKRYVKVENVTTAQTDVDSGKIIITDTEEDDIPVTNIDDMVFDDDDDDIIDIPDVKSRKVAPPSGIDTHLDLSSIVNEEPEIKVQPIPSPVRPCNISFVGEYVKLDKNLLIKTRSKVGRGLRFKESTPEVHEYPSEMTMMSFFPEEEQEDYDTSRSNISDDDTDEEPDMKRDVTDNNMMSSPNQVVGSPVG